MINFNLLINKLIQESSSPNLLFVLCLQTCIIIGFVFEPAEVTLDVVRDQVVAERSERNVQSNSMKWIHQNVIVFAIIDESVGRTNVFEFHTVDWDDAEHRKHEKFSHFSIWIQLFLANTKDHLLLNSPKENRGCRFTSSAKSKYPLNSPSTFLFVESRSPDYLVGLGQAASSAVSEKHSIVPEEHCSTKLISNFHLQIVAGNLEIVVGSLAYWQSSTDNPCTEKTVLLPRGALL